MHFHRRLLRVLEIALAPFALFGAAHAEPVGEHLGAGMARFWPDSAARDAALPSLALSAPRPALGELPEGFAVLPRFSSALGGRIVRIEVPRGTSLYGTGETGGALQRNGRVTTCWNTDAYKYDSRTASLYQSHPWVLAVRADGTSFGVLADTASSSAPRARSSRCS